MSTVSLRLNGKEYTVACDEGQEAHLFALAENIDTRLRGLSSQSAQVGENYLLVLTALMLTDELKDLQQENASLREQLRNSSHSFEQNKSIEIEAAVASSMHQIANRLERLNNLLA